MKKHKTTPVGHHAGLQKIHAIFCGIRELARGYGGGVNLTHPSRRGSAWACEKTLIFRRKCKMKLFKKLAAAAAGSCSGPVHGGLRCRTATASRHSDLKNEVLQSGREITYYMSGRMRPTPLPWIRKRLHSLLLLQRLEKQKAIMRRCKNFCKSTTKRQCTLRSLRLYTHAAYRKLALCQTA